MADTRRLESFFLHLICLLADKKHVSSVSKSAPISIYLSITAYTLDRLYIDMDSLFLTHKISGSLLPLYITPLQPSSWLDVSRKFYIC